MFMCWKNIPIAKEEKTWNQQQKSGHKKDVLILSQLLPPIPRSDGTARRKIRWDFWRTFVTKLMWKFGVLMGRYCKD